MKVKLHREILGKIKTVTIKQEFNKWYVCISVESEIIPLQKTGQFVGIDVGIENFATLSDGTQIENWKYYESSQKEFRRLQRSVSRKKKGSGNRRKAVLKLKKFHQKIKNQRNDFQHKVSRKLVKNFDIIAIEKLNILGISKGVLSKQIHDVSWSSFFQKLKYKAENADKTLIAVSPNYTSQDCSCCGERIKKDLSIRVHHCSGCGLSLHRDINASINILRLGLSRLALTKTVGL